MSKNFSEMPALNNKKEIVKKVALAVSGVLALGAVDNADAGGVKKENLVEIDGKVIRMTDQGIKRPQIVDVINNAPKSGNIEVDLSGQLATDNDKVIGNKNKDPKDMIFETQEQMDKAYQDDLMKKSGIR